jgi:hypothetical protein
MIVFVNSLSLFRDFGTLVVNQIDVPIYAKMNCRDSHDYHLHDDTPHVLNRETFHLSDPFINALATVYFTMSMRHKLLLLSEMAHDALPALAWVL